VGRGGSNRGCRTAFVMHAEFGKELDSASVLSAQNRHEEGLSCVLRMCVRTVDLAPLFGS